MSDIIKFRETGYNNEEIRDAEGIDFLRFFKGDTSAELDGHFSIDDLTAIIAEMRKYQEQETTNASSTD